jgi:hypothetical protein
VEHARAARHNAGEAQFDVSHFTNTTNDGAAEGQNAAWQGPGDNCDVVQTRRRKSNLIIPPMRSTTGLHSYGRLHFPDAFIHRG